MKFSILCGSHRHNSQSLKVSRVLENAALEQQLADEVWLLDLAESPLPMWDEGARSGDGRWPDILGPISAQLESSDGLIVVVPEYHGQVPAAVKNFFLMWKQELAHKPGLIVAVSAGPGGAYPVAELRMSSYKNNRLCYVPDHLIIRNVGKVLNDDPDANDEKSDTFYRNRINWSLRIFRQYALALKQVRDSGVTATDTYINGM